MRGGKPVPAFPLDEVTFPGALVVHRPGKNLGTERRKIETIGVWARYLSNTSAQLLQYLSKLIFRRKCSTLSLTAILLPHRLGVNSIFSHFVCLTDLDHIASAFCHVITSSNVEHVLHSFFSTTIRCFHLSDISNKSTCITSSFNAGYLSIKPP